MAIPSRRLRAGKIDIDNKGRFAEKEEEKQITPEEHEERLKILRDMGILK